jgi:hypothetical protein
MSGRAQTAAASAERGEDFAYDDDWPTDDYD